MATPKATSIDAWRLFRCIENKFVSGERFTWDEIKSVAPPCAITPSRGELSLSLIRELVRANRLSATDKNLKKAEFTLHD